MNQQAVVKYKVSPRLCRCPFLRLDGGRGGGGGGGGIRVDNSVVAERAGGAGGGASRPTPINRVRNKTTSKRVVRLKEAAATDSHLQASES